MNYIITDKMLIDYNTIETVGNSKNSPNKKFKMKE